MSKALKAVAKKYRPAVADKMVPANGYDEKKHLFPSDLAKAGVIDSDESNDLDGCLEDLAGANHPIANALKAAKNGKISKDKLNDDDFISTLEALAASDPGVDDDNADDTDGVMN